MPFGYHKATVFVSQFNLMLLTVGLPYWCFVFCSNDERSNNLKLSHMSWYYV